MISDPNKPKKLSANEGIKESSDYLRGTIIESCSMKALVPFLPRMPNLQSFMGPICRTTVIKEQA